MKSELNYMLTLVCLSLLLTGCGGGPELPPLGKVEGTVSLNGSPLSGANVYFYPLEEGKGGSIAVTDSQGKYRLRYGSTAFGALIGKHKVVIDAGDGEEFVPPPGVNLDLINQEETERLRATQKRVVVPSKYNIESELVSGKVGCQTYNQAALGGRGALALPKPLVSVLHIHNLHLLLFEC